MSEFPLNLHSRVRPCRRAFTLVELLVVIGLVALLTAILCPAFNSARMSARRGVEIAAARHAVQAWTMYATDRDGQVLPGFKSGLNAYQADGTVIQPGVYGGAPTIAARWPWRLAPYFSGDMKSLYVGEQSELLSALENGDPAQYLYFTSLYPTLGLNSTWVGGDSERMGFLPSTLPNGERNPFSRFYVTRLAECRHPERLIVFASSRTAATTDGQITQGYFRVESPWFVQQQWGPRYLAAEPPSCGNLSARYHDEVVISTVDGAAGAVMVDSLRDMRRWADPATTLDYHLGP